MPVCDSEGNKSLKRHRPNLGDISYLLSIQMTQKEINDRVRVHKVQTEGQHIC